MSRTTTEISKARRAESKELATTQAVELQQPRRLGTEFDLTTIVAGRMLATQEAGLLAELLANTRAAGLRHKLFLSIREASEYTGLPISVIRRLVKAEQLPAVKVGGWRIKRKYLDALELRHIRRLNDYS